MTDSGTNETTLKIGGMVAEKGGGVYVGKSATTGKDLYAAPADETEYLNLSDAYEAAAQMRKQPGREDARAPTMEERDSNLSNNRNMGQLKGTFNDLNPGSAYRFSALFSSLTTIARAQQWFACRNEDYRYSSVRLPVRLVW